MIKIIGMACVLISATLLGWYMDRIKVLRIEDLQDFKKTLYMLKGEVNYSVTPLPTALKEILAKNNSRTNCIFHELVKLMEKKSGQGMFQLWQTALKGQGPNTYLEDEDIKNLLSFGQSLGYLDKEMQKKNIDLTLDYLEKQTVKLEKQAEKNGRLYKSLGVLGGCLLCILLF